MTRVRISDPTLLGGFADFLAQSGFLVEPEDADTLRLGLPLTPGPTRTEADIETLLAVWLEVGLRIWRDRCPESHVIVLAGGPAEESAAPAALAS